MHAEPGAAADRCRIRAFRGKFSLANRALLQQQVGKGKVLSYGCSLKQPQMAEVGVRADES